MAADLKSARQGSIDGSTLPVVLFDRDCGFCQWSIALIPKIGAHVLLLPITPNNLARYRLDPVRAKLEMPLVLPHGGVRWGSRAWVEILLVARWPYRILGRAACLPGLSQLVAALYRQIALHRRSLSYGSSCSIG